MKGLPILWIALSLLVLGGIAWAVWSSQPTPTRTDNTLQTTNAQPAKDTNTVQPGTASTNSSTSQSLDIDDDIQAIDETMNSVDDNDFSADQLSDDSLQLQ